MDKNKMMLYPLVTAIFILLSGFWFWNYSADTILNYSGKAAQIKANKELAAALETKLNRLKEVNMDQEKRRLEDMLDIAPAGKNIWEMLINLRSAAEESGAELVSYTSSKVGKVEEAEVATDSGATADTPPSLNVTFKVKDTGQLKDLLSAIYRKKPAIRIAQSNFTAPDGLVVTVESAWLPFVAGEAAAGAPIPEYTKAYNNLMKLVEGFDVRFRVDPAMVKPEPGFENQEIF